jgi:HNH endonuclease
MEAEASEVDKTEQLKQKLLSRIVKVDGSLDSQCWVWTGASDWDGYGKLRWEGKLQMAHRVAYTCYIGPIPDGLRCCHDCDNPPCINPFHMFLGTDKDNMEDAVRKRRHAFGEIIGKLSNDKVASIKFLLSTGRYPIAGIAEHFDVDYSSISYIAQGGWSHIAPAASYDGPPIRERHGGSGEGNSSVVLTELEAMTVKRLLLNGLSIAYIAYRYGMDCASIHHIKTGYTWSWVEPLPPDAEIIYPSPEVIAVREHWRLVQSGALNANVKIRRRL